jgi:hypothetical protein
MDRLSEFGGVQILGFPDISANITVAIFWVKLSEGLTVLHKV